MTRRERLERKAEKRREWADGREAKADAAHARVHEIADGIPFGQPILVGHHSEGRARRDQARMEAGMRSSVDNSRAATEHREKAAGIEAQLRTAVFSDDEDAVERLTEIVADLEAQRDRLKAYNASCRRGGRDTSLLDEKQRAELVSIARAAPYQLGTNGAFPSYALSNLGATIRQKKQRIEQITRERVATEAGVRTGGRVMLARYGGTCADCGGEIDRGTPITWYRTTKEAVHTTCPARAEQEKEPDPFPLVEETSDPSELPTVEEWLAGGAPMREVTDEPSGHGPEHFGAQNGDFAPPPGSEHPCDARPVAEGGDLAYLGDYGAPGIGQAWECGVCGRGYSKIGGAFVEASAGAHLLEPGDVV